MAARVHGAVAVIRAWHVGGLPLHRAQEHRFAGRDVAWSAAAHRCICITLETSLRGARSREGHWRLTFARNAA